MNLTDSHLPESENYSFFSLFSSLCFVSFFFFVIDFFKVFLLIFFKELLIIIFFFLTDWTLQFSNILCCGPGNIFVHLLDSLPFSMSKVMAGHVIKRAVG